MDERRILDQFEKATGKDTIIPLISGESEGNGWQITGGIFGWFRRIWRRANNGRRK
jgi:hypothetical protein